MPYQNHTLEISAGPNRQSRAWWSLDPDGKILIFIHGFGGRATKTWQFFPKLLLNDNTFSGYDLLFYSYDSQHDTALVSASILFDFIDPFLTNPGYLINEQVDSTRAWNFRHSEIYIIAHSLGAPIARKMLLAALARKSTWLPRVKLIFFAPATAGARAEEISRLAFGWFYQLYRYSCPVVDDLRTGSAFLKGLYSETDKAVSSNGGKVFQASGTFFGEHEKWLS